MRNQIESKVLISIPNHLYSTFSAEAEYISLRYVCLSRGRLYPLPTCITGSVERLLPLDSLTACNLSMEVALEPQSKLCRSEKSLSGPE